VIWTPIAPNGATAAAISPTTPVQIGEGLQNTHHWTSHTAHHSFRGGQKTRRRWWFPFMVGHRAMQCCVHKRGWLLLRGLTRAVGKILFEMMQMFEVQHDTSVEYILHTYIST
jgi:hypothetical protein